MLAAVCLAVLALLSTWAWRGDGTRSATELDAAADRGSPATTGSLAPVASQARETRPPLRVGDVRQAVRADPQLMQRPRETRLWEPSEEPPPLEEWDAEELDLPEGEEYRDPEWEWPEDQEPADDEEAREDEEPVE